MKRQIVPDVISNEQELFSINPDASAAEAARALVERHVAAVLVLEGDELVGILTERDLVYRVMAKNLQPEAVAVRDVMTKEPVTVAPSESAAMALDRMRKGHFRHLPVVEAGRVRGIVSIRDLYEALAASLEEDLHSAETLIYGEQYGGLSA